MQKEIEQLPEINLVGIQVRTSYKAELNKLAGNIFPCVRSYFHKRLFEKISHRKRPGRTFCAYTDYESDYKGAYTYFIGEEVTSLDLALDKGFSKLTIPAQTYAKFTTGPAPMPAVVVDAWEAIWKMTPEVLGGKRNYLSDFEIYDERAADHSKIVMDLFIGISGCERC
jgi:predicted transcriptional regulator YdeE